MSIEKHVDVEQWAELVNSGINCTLSFFLEGTSMQPLIRIYKDSVTVTFPKAPYKIGDIVLFRDDAGRHIVHRIKSIKNGKVITLGDNCISPDKENDISNVLGLVTSMRRNGKEFDLTSSFWQFYGKAVLALFPLRRLRKIFFNKIKRIGILK